jgi:hypothetical protein
MARRPGRSERHPSSPPGGRGGPCDGLAASLVEDAAFISAHRATTTHLKLEMLTANATYTGLRSISASSERGVEYASRRYDECRFLRAASTRQIESKPVCS